MAFKPIDVVGDGQNVTLETASDTTITKFDALVDDGNGYVQRATSSATEVRYVALEAVTTAAGEHEDILVVRTDGVRFEADTNANPAQTDVFTKADLTDHDTLNESASTNDVFFIERIKGAASDKKVQGYFVV